MSLYDFYPMKKRKICQTTPNGGRSASTLGKLKKSTDQLPTAADSGIEVLWDNNSPSPSTTLALAAGKRRRKRHNNRNNGDSGITDISFVVQKLSENTSPVVDHTRSTLLDMWVSHEQGIEQDNDPDFTSPPNQVRQSEKPDDADLTTPSNQRRTSKRNSRKASRHFMLEIRKLVDEIQKNDGAGHGSQRSSQCLKEQDQCKRQQAGDIAAEMAGKSDSPSKQQTSTPIPPELRIPPTNGVVAEDSFEWTEDDMDDLILTCQLSSSGKGGSFDIPEHPNKPQFGSSPSTMTVIEETQFLFEDTSDNTQPQLGTKPFCNAPAVTSTAKPVVTSSVKPIVTSSVKPIVTSSVKPVVTSSVKPVMASSVKPAVMSSVKPVVTSSVKPAVMSSVKPVMTPLIVTSSIVTPHRATMTSHPGTTVEDTQERWDMSFATDDDSLLESAAQEYELSQQSVPQKPPDAIQEDRSTTRTGLNGQATTHSDTGTTTSSLYTKIHGKNSTEGFSVSKSVVSGPQSGSHVGRNERNASNKVSNGNRIMVTDNAVDKSCVETTSASKAGRCHSKSVVSGPQSGSYVGRNERNALNKVSNGNRVMTDNAVSKNCGETKSVSKAVYHSRPVVPGSQNGTYVGKERSSSNKVSTGNRMVTDNAVNKNRGEITSVNKAVHYARPVVSGSQNGTYVERGRSSSNKVSGDDRITTNTTVKTNCSGTAPVNRAAGYNSLSDKTGAPFKKPSACASKTGPGANNVATVKTEGANGSYTATSTRKNGVVTTSGENMMKSGTHCQKTDENSYSSKGPQYKGHTMNSFKLKSPLKGRSGNLSLKKNKLDMKSSQMGNANTSGNFASKASSEKQCESGKSVLSSGVMNRFEENDVKCLLSEENLDALLEDINLEDMCIDQTSGPSNVIVASNPQQPCQTSKNIAPQRPSQVATAVKKTSYSKQEIERKRLEAQRRRQQAKQQAAKFKREPVR